MPLLSEVRIDTFLTNVLAGIRNDNYVADMVLPPIFPSKETGKLAKLDDSHYRLDFAERAPGGPGHRIEWGATSVAFTAEEYRVEFAVDDRLAAQYDEPFDAFRDGTLNVNEKLQLKKEDLIATLVMTAGNYATTSAGPDAWDGAGTPVTDVLTGIRTIVNATGVNPANLIGVCGYDVFTYLRLNSEVFNHYLNTVPGAAAPRSLDAQQVAVSLGLSDLIVGTAVKNTANEGATASVSPVWGTQTFAIVYRTPSPGIMTPNFGYQVYPRIPGFAGAQVAVDRYREESVSSNVVRGRLLLDELVAENRLGYLFENVTT